MVFEYFVTRALMKLNKISTDNILWKNTFDGFLRSYNLVGFSPQSNRNIRVTANEFDNFEKVKCFSTNLVPSATADMHASIPSV